MWLEQGLLFRNRPGRISAATNLTEHCRSSNKLEIIRTELWLKLYPIKKKTFLTATLTGIPSASSIYDNFLSQTPET